MHHLESNFPVSSTVESDTTRKEYIKPSLESFGTWEIPVGQTTGSVVPCDPLLGDCGLPGG
jgi:hypothetical protein